MASVESWAPEDRRAWRLRQAMSFRGVPRDVFALSDLLLIDPESDPGDAEELLEALQPSTVVGGDAAAGVAFEIYGLRPRGEVVHYRAWVEPQSEGLLTRFGRWLGSGGARRRRLAGERACPGGRAPSCARSRYDCLGWARVPTRSSSRCSPRAGNRSRLAAPSRSSQGCSPEQPVGRPPRQESPLDRLALRCSRAG